jgi:hypothetical protein
MRSLQRLRRAAAGAVLALAVLWLHGLLLGALAARESADAALAHAVAAPPLRLAVRLLRPQPLPVAPTPTPTPTPAMPALAPAAKAPLRREAMPLRTGLGATPLAAAPIAAAKRPTRTTPLPTEAAADASTAAAAVEAEAADAQALAPPLDPTRLPPNASLHYRAQRGDALGSLRLQWQHDAAGGYWLRLDAWLAAAGRRSAAPDRRRRRGTAAPRRIAARVSARGELPARRGAHRSRPAAGARRPARRTAWLDGAAWRHRRRRCRAGRAGARITLFVVGARGDADAWHFEVLGVEPLALPVGAVADALHLKREAARPYDTRVEVWLDPARQHLPVRALLTTLPGGLPLQLDLAPTPASDLEIGAAAPR